MPNLLTRRRIITDRSVRPEAVPGLQVWLDASDTSTHTLSGSNVTQLADKSGFARHVTSATASLPPTATTATPNGLTALSFTGQQLDQPSPLTYTVGTLLAAWEHPTTTSASSEGICEYRMSGTIGSSMELEFILPLSNPTTRVLGLTNLAYGRFIANGQDRPSAEKESTNASPAKTSPNRWNVGAITQTPSSGNKRLCLGADAYAPGTRRVQDCRIGEIIVYDRILSDSEVRSLIRYLTTKWGATP